MAPVTVAILLFWLDVVNDSLKEKEKIKIKKKKSLLT